MTIFDAHTHIHFPAYDKDREVVIKRAQAAGVKMITVGTNLETSQSAVDLAKQYPEDIWATAGFHPAHAGEGWYHDKKEQKGSQQESFDKVALLELAKDDRVVAIGECGLDYFRGKKNEAAQREVFQQQQAIAQELNKPLMIHCRPTADTDDAYEDLVELLNPNTPTIIHFFVGSVEVAKKLLAKNCLFTFGGVITFVREYDEVIKNIPLANIMLETDAPYVTPDPYRGKRNESAYVVEVAKKIAEIKDIDYDEVVTKTTNNAKKVFNI
jgi:TatD DNase family protein